MMTYEEMANEIKKTREIRTKIKDKTSVKERILRKKEIILINLLARVRR